MELTLKDRLILANQYLILEKLCPDKADHYANLYKVVNRGYTLQYKECVQYFDEELSADDCLEVRDILDMYESLKFAFKILDNKDGIDPRHIKFLGFWGNGESKLMGYASYFIEDLGHFEELKNDNPGFNSHCPMLPKYRIMLAEWHKSANRHYLTEADIQRIVGAQ